MSELWPGWWWASLILLVLVSIGWWLSFTAGRVDRLHARVEASRSALDAQLVRRSSVALQLAIAGLLDPAASLVLAAAAIEARESENGHREEAESDLSGALRAVLDVAEETPSEDDVTNSIAADRSVEQGRDPGRAAPPPAEDHWYRGGDGGDSEQRRELLAELAAAARRVQLARRFHNDAVRATRDARRGRSVRWLRLAGHAPMPPSFEIDDDMPFRLRP